MRLAEYACSLQVREFPFLFGGTFIEANSSSRLRRLKVHFPSFSEGLSLRLSDCFHFVCIALPFPFLFGGTFIEADVNRSGKEYNDGFPFLFGGTFIEAVNSRDTFWCAQYFPSFSEGLSLRPHRGLAAEQAADNFPSFSEGLSLRPFPSSASSRSPRFPFLFGGTFIEARGNRFLLRPHQKISLPFRRDFH